MYILIYMQECIYIYRFDNILPMVISIKNTQLTNLGYYNLYPTNKPDIYSVALFTINLSLGIILVSTSHNG